VLKTPVGSLFDLTTTGISDRLICPTDSLARDIMTSYLVEAEKIRVVPNGIDLEALDKTKSSDLSVLGNYGLQEGSYLLYVGRLSCFKGLEFLIEAFKEVKKEHTHLKLVLAGRGDFEKYLRRMAGNDGNIVFTGHIDSLPLKKLLYEASLAVVLPSTVDEVLPLMVLEAMAFGKPVVGTNVGGVPLLIRHGRSGFLVAPKNSRELAKFIKVLCEDSGLRRKMGLIGRNIVETEFTVGQMVGKTLKIYESMLA
jgi:glycosyltransferase involved in cell wall biosynthesis